MTKKKEFNDPVAYNYAKSLPEISLVCFLLSLDVAPKGVPMYNRAFMACMIQEGWIVSTSLARRGRYGKPRVRYDMSDKGRVLCQQYDARVEHTGEWVNRPDRTAIPLAERDKEALLDDLLS